jgi:hypothetical protein
MCDGPCPGVSGGGGAGAQGSDSDSDEDERAAGANPHKQGVEHSLKTLPPDMLQMLKNATGNADMVRMITERAQKDMPAHEFEQMKAVLAALSQSSLHGGK